MTATAWAGAAAAVALVLTPLVLRDPPDRLIRTNVNGRPVAAVLGLPLVGGISIGLLGLALTAPAMTDRRVLLAVGPAMIVMAVAGWWDDLRGDERQRGFRGHLTALLSGSVTGGLVKIAAGVAAGALAALLVEGRAWDRVMLAFIVPLSANVVNLLDRAPGRAGKFALALLALAALGPASSAIVMGPPLAALAVVLVWDLRERGMLGDAGANAIGAVGGLGVGLALHGVARALLLAAFLGANLASERWSFSRIIERSRVLRSLDRLGRRRP